jgi:hypothetical protein
MTQVISKVAAKWWADHLRNGSKNDNEDNDPLTSLMAGLMQQETLDKTSTEQINIFEERLAEIIEIKKPRLIDVDYHPDIYLSDAAQEADIILGIGTLPMKTTMWIDENKIQVRYGCGAGRETIYSAE